MKRILIVEDDLILSLLLEKHLQKMGFEIAAKVNNGEDAVGTIRHEKPDLVLMDIKLLGEMDGVEATRRVREFSEVPVLYLTGNSDETTKKRALATNPVAYMVKPVDMSRLKNTILNVLVQKRPQMNN
ncbi:MAG: response regulator [Cyclonatronaceae bacterium]